MPLIDYIACASGYWVMFFVIYKTLIHNKLHFKMSRFYLILTTVLGWILPSIQLGNWLEIPAPQASILIRLYAQFSPHQVWHQFNYSKILWWIYGMGVCLQLFRFLMNLAQIGQLLERYPREKQPQNFYEIRVPRLLEAFSFGHFLFIPASSNYSAQEFVLIKEHEIQHIKQKHTQEVLFFEILTLVLWFHPLIYIYQNELKKLHEFSADFGVLQTYSDVEFYKKILITNFLEKNQLTLTHPFSEKKLLQSRLQMMLRYGEKSTLSRTWMVGVGLVILSGVGFNSVWFKASEAHTKFVFLRDSERANFPSGFQGKKEFLVSEDTKIQYLKTALRAGKTYSFDLDHTSDLPKGTKVTLHDSQGNLVAENFGKYKSEFVFECRKTDIYTLRISFRYAQFRNGTLRVSFD